MKNIKIGALLFISATTTLLSQQAVNLIEKVKIIFTPKNIFSKQKKLPKYFC
jgi:hypothetical protein